MATSGRETRVPENWALIAVIGSAALGAFGLVYLLRRRNPGRTVDRLLRRCEQRIEDLESAVIGLESALSPDGG